MLILAVLCQRKQFLGDKDDLDLAPIMWAPVDPCMGLAYSGSKYPDAPVIGESC